MEDQEKFIASIREDGMLDISMEKWRKYHYPDGQSFRINRPKSLHVKRREDGTDSHRIVSTEDHGFYIKPGWMAIEWENETVIGDLGDKGPIVF